MRLATPHHLTIRYDDLGALALLADVPTHTLEGNGDVCAVARIADRHEVLETLEAYLDTGSVRHAAGRLHLHHSSVARRLDNLATTLGFELTGPAGLVRGSLALAAWRLTQE